MVNEKTQLNNVVNVEFKLLEWPVTAQITIHVNNLILTYGNKVLGDFKNHLYQNESTGGLTIEQLINYYGHDKMKEYFNLIYGWNFTEKAG